MKPCMLWVGHQCCSTYIYTCGHKPHEMRNILSYLRGYGGLGGLLFPCFENGVIIAGKVIDIDKRKRCWLEKYSPQKKKFLIWDNTKSVCVSLVYYLAPRHPTKIRPSFLFQVWLMAPLTHIFTGFTLLKCDIKNRTGRNYFTVPIVHLWYTRTHTHSTQHTHACTHTPHHSYSTQHTATHTHTHTHTTVICGSGQPVCSPAGRKGLTVANNGEGRPSYFVWIQSSQEKVSMSFPHTTNFSGMTEWDFHHPLQQSWQVYIIM